MASNEIVPRDREFVFSSFLPLLDILDIKATNDDTFTSSRFSVNSICCHCQLVIVVVVVVVYVNV